MPSATPLICLVTDRLQTDPSARTTSHQISSLERLMDEAIDVGVDLIQIRERDLAVNLLCALVARTSRRAERSSTRVVVNDRADVAVAARAAGVHLREGGPDAARVRSVMPAGTMVGRSVHTPSAAGADSAADYIFFGPVYPSRSKPAGWQAAGLGALRSATGAEVPVIAIGGVTVRRARACLEAGASGVAAIGLFLPTESRPDGLGPRGAVVALRAAFSGYGA